MQSHRLVIHQKEPTKRPAVKGGLSFCVYQVMAEKIIADRCIYLDETKTMGLEEADIRQAHLLVGKGCEIDVNRLAEVACAVGEDGKIIVGAPVVTALEPVAEISDESVQVATVVAHDAEPVADPELETDPEPEPETETETEPEPTKKGKK